jgi:hypothetical protein
MMRIFVQLSKAIFLNGIPSAQLADGMSAGVEQRFEPPTFGLFR